MSNYAQMGTQTVYRRRKARKCAIFSHSVPQTQVCDSVNGGGAVPDNSHSTRPALKGRRLKHCREASIKAKNIKGVDRSVDPSLFMLIQ